MAILATFILYVAGMADEKARAYGSVAPLKVGLLNDYPTQQGTDNDTLDTLFQHADRALYDAKNSGRNRIAVARQ